MLAFGCVHGTVTGTITVLAYKQLIMNERDACLALISTDDDNTVIDTVLI